MTKRTAYVGTYKQVPKVSWNTLNMVNFNAEGESIDWLSLYPIKVNPNAAEDELPTPTTNMSPRQAAKLFYDAIYLIEQTEKNPKFMQDKLPELAQKAYKRKQYQKSFLEGARRVCCRLAKGKLFSPNCIAEDVFIIILLSNTFQLGWRRIEQYIEGVPECKDDRDFSKIHRICGSGEVELLWRGADAVAASNSKKKGAEKAALKEGVTDPRTWFKGYDQSAAHLLDHVISVQANGILIVTAIYVVRN